MVFYHQSSLAYNIDRVFSGISWSVHAQLATEQEVRTTLEKQGYQQVRDINFSKNGINAKAIKNGQQVSLIIDTSGKVMERKQE